MLRKFCYVSAHTRYNLPLRYFLSLLLLLFIFSHGDIIIIWFAHVLLLFFLLPQSEMYIHNPYCSVYSILNAALEQMTRWFVTQTRAYTIHFRKHKLKDQPAVCSCDSNQKDKLNVRWREIKKKNRPNQQNTHERKHTAKEAATEKRRRKVQSKANKLFIPKKNDRK